MSLQHKNVVVLGAAGVVGSGIVRRYLDAGATVVAVSRSMANLERLHRQIDVGGADRFLAVTGDFRDTESAAQAQRDVAAALGGQPIDHVVSAQGFVPFAGSPTATPLAQIKGCLDDGFYNNLLAAQVFLPGMKDRKGASFTLVSGGLAHVPPPNLAVWLGTVKNAALNALNLALLAETAGDSVRVNTVCIHFGVAPIGGDKNQFGMQCESDTLRLGAAFVGVAQGTYKGQLLCLSSWDDADRLAAG